MNKKYLLFIVLAFLSVNSTFSQIDIIWNGDGAAGVWEDPDNWDLDRIPNLSTDDVLISGAYSVTVSSTSTIESIVLAGGADLTIAATYTLTVSGNGGNDGIELDDTGTSLIVDGTLNSNNHGVGIDINAGCSLTVNSTGTLSIDNVTGNGLELSDNLINDGIITITNHSKDGLRLEGSVPNRTVVNTGSITISDGLYGINQSQQNWLFTNNGTVTISNANMALVRDGTDFINNGTFKGNGLVENGNNNDFSTPPGSTLSPGTSIGKLTFTDKVDFTDNIINIEIDGDGIPGLDYDQIVVNSGTVKITDAILNLSGSYIPTGGEVFLFLEKVNTGNLNGEFLGLPDGATIPFNGSAFIINYNGGVGGNDVTLTFDAPLPVELIDFNARPMENEVKLAWTTATETNNDFFTIERSHDGRSFEAVATISGNGNTTEISKYNHMDKNPQNGLNYYRLKQTDYDGQFSYSDIKTVELTIDHTIKVYPTIVSDVITVENASDLNNELVVIIRDLTGRAFESVIIPTKSKREEIALSNLSPGTYFISIYNNDTMETYKFIKL